jgi:hypothetical protein
MARLWDRGKKRTPEEQAPRESGSGRTGGFFRGLFRGRNQRTDTENRSVRGPRIERVFRNEFVVDSIVIDGKDIMPYIRGKAQSVIGDDFFYSHVYDRRLKTLSFIAFKSGSWDCGKLPWLAPAMLSEGDYYHRVGDSYYMVTSRNGIVRVELDYEGRDGYLDIGEAPLPETIPATLMVRWSLNRRTWMVHLALVALFAISVLFCIDSTNAYTDAARNPRGVAPARHVEGAARTRHMASVPTLIQNVAAAIDGKGVVEKAEVSGDTMTFTMQFDKYYDAENFLSKFTGGGKYENGKVVYSAPLTDGK